jgi:hypothetical protein
MNMQKRMLNKTGKFRNVVCKKDECCPLAGKVFTLKLVQIFSISTLRSLAPFRGLPHTTGSAGGR